MDDSPPRVPRWLLLLALVTSLGLGTGKVLWERAHPPPFAQKAANSFEGFVSIDGYSLRADHVRRWVGGEAGARDALLEELRSPMHPTTIAVPAVVGALAPDAPSVPVVFLALSLFATLLTCALVARLGALVCADAPAAGAWTAALLCAGHCTTARTAGHLYMDPFCALFGVWTWLAALRWARTPGASGVAGMLVPLTLGVFTKVSFLPFVAAPLLALLARGGAGRQRLAAAILVPLVPLALAGAYLAAVPGLGASAEDTRHLLGATALSGRRLADFALEMALLLQLAPLILLRGGVGRSAEARGTAWMLVLVLLSTWAVRLPSVPRLYLPVVGLGAAVVAPALVRCVHPERRTALLLAWVVVNAALSALIAFVL